MAVSGKGGYNGGEAEKALLGFVGMTPPGAAEFVFVIGELFMLLNCFAVALGGGIGSACRYLIGLLPFLQKGPLPLQTLLVNVLAGIYILVSVMLCLMGVFAGQWLAESFS